MKLQSPVIVGGRKLEPRLRWSKDGQRRWQSRKDSHVFWVKEFPPKDKSHCPVWEIGIKKIGRGYSRLDQREAEIGIVYSRETAMAVAELIEAKEEFFSRASTAERHCQRLNYQPGRESAAEWGERGDNSFYAHLETHAYYLYSSKDEGWCLRIMYPGGADETSNLNAWELKDLADQEVAKAIVSLIEDDR